MPSHFFVEAADFGSFARYVCSLRENPLRVYCHKLNKKQVVSSRRILSKSLFSIYSTDTKNGRYVSYNAKGGREEFDIVNSTKSFAQYAPIINLHSLPSKFVINPKKIDEKFIPVHVEDLGSLARLTYDPELPDEIDLTLFLFPLKTKWIIGYITSMDLEDILHFFNYVELDNEPTKPFLQYSNSDDKTPVFTDKFQHGLSYLPVIKLKEAHPIFGLK